MGFRNWFLRPALALLRDLVQDSARQTASLRRIDMNQTELAQALADVSTELGAVSDQLQKGIDEVVAAVGNSGGTTPEVDAALSRLRGLADGLKTKTQALDDLNADAQPGTDDTLPGGVANPPVVGGDGNPL